MKKIILIFLLVFSLITIDTVVDIIGANTNENTVIEYKKYVKEKKIHLEFNDSFREIKEYAKDNKIDIMNVNVIDMDGNILFESEMELKDSIKFDFDDLEISGYYSTTLMRINIIIGDRFFTGLYEKIYVSMDNEDENLLNDAAILQAKKNNGIIFKEMFFDVEDLDNIPVSMNAKNVALSLPLIEELEDLESCVIIPWMGILPVWYCLAFRNREYIYENVPIADIQSVEGVSNTFTFGLSSSITSIMEISAGSSYEGAEFEVTGSRSLSITSTYGFSYTVEDGESKILGTKFQFMEHDFSVVVLDMTKTFPISSSGVYHEIYATAFVGGVEDMGPSYGSNYKVSYVLDNYLGSEYQTYPQGTSGVYWGNEVSLKYTDGVKITTPVVTVELSSEVVTIGNYRYTADFRNYYDEFNVTVPSDFLYYVYGYTKKPGPRFTVTTNPFRLQYPSSC